MLVKSSKHIFSLFLADIPPRVLQVVFITYLSICFSSTNFARYGEVLAYSATISIFLTFGLTALFPLDYNKSKTGLLNQSELCKKYLKYIVALASFSGFLFFLYIYTYTSSFPAFVHSSVLLILFASSRSLTAIILTINRLVSSGLHLVTISYACKLPSLVFPLAALFVSKHYSGLSVPTLQSILLIDILAVLLFLPLSISLILPGFFFKYKLVLLTFEPPLSFKLLSFLKSYGKDCFLGLSFIIPQLLFTALVNLDRSLFASYVSSSELDSFVSCSAALALLSLPAGWLSSSLDKIVLAKSMNTRSVVNSHIQLCFVCSLIIVVGSGVYSLIAPPILCKYAGGFWCTAYNSQYLKLYLLIAILSLSGDLFSNLSFYIKPSRVRMAYFYGTSLITSFLTAPIFFFVFKSAFWPQLSVLFGLIACTILWITSLYRMRDGYA